MARSEADLLHALTLFLNGDDDAVWIITQHFVAALLAARNQVITENNLEDPSAMNESDLLEMSRHIAVIMFGFRERMQEIEDEGELADNIAWQWERIFIDQTVRAIEAGKLFGYMFVERVSGQVWEKTWMSRLAHNTCAVCEELHGMTIPVQQDFLSLGQILILPNDRHYAQTYGNLSAPSVHPHCQCWLMYTRRN